MKISVVIPVYNEEKYIENCLKSLFQQSTLPDEVIIVDNNSTDRTVEIAKKFPVRVEKQSIQGIIPTRNKGYDLAKSEIIVRTDADTLLPKHWLENIKKDFELEKCDGVIGSVYYNNIWSPLNKIIFEGFAELVKIMFGEYPMIGPNMAITSTIWKRVRNQICLDDKQVHEDIDLSIHIKKIGGTIFFDRNNIVRTSQRRLVGNPASFFLEYPARLIKMKLSH